MPNKIYCSCLICKKQTTSKNLKFHIFSDHTVEGFEMKKQQQETLQESKNQRIENYYKNPKLCSHCLKQLSYEDRHKKFCNQSCSAKFNNKNRSLESRKRQSETLRQTSTNNKKINSKFLCYPYKSLISFCVICGSIIKHKHIKTCSEQCYKTILSNKAKERVASTKYNRGRHKKSYLEQSFLEWLNFHNFKDFINEYKVRDIKNNKTFFIDFYFPSLNLAIELDGSQHKDTIEKDKIRDKFISNHLKCEIIRVSHSEYQKKTKLNLIKSLLNI